MPAELCHMNYQGASKQRKLPSASPKASSLQPQQVLRVCTESHRAWWPAQHLTNGLAEGCTPRTSRHLGKSVWLLLPRKAHLGMPAGVSPLPVEKL